MNQGALCSTFHRPSDIHVDGGRSNGGSDLGDSLLMQKIP